MTTTKSAAKPAAPAAASSTAKDKKSRLDDSLPNLVSLLAKHRKKAHRRHRKELAKVKQELENALDEKEKALSGFNDERKKYAQAMENLSSDLEIKEAELRAEKSIHDYRYSRRSIQQEAFEIMKLQTENEEMNRELKKAKEENLLAGFERLKQTYELGVARKEVKDERERFMQLLILFVKEMWCMYGSSKVMEKIGAGIREAFVKHLEEKLDHGEYLRWEGELCRYMKHG
ncbi:hypothetical protein CC80DRAFT_581320 [Byssothecium circinans]|uniref:Uncharacterized protein n=1 Tax=Byssothecium circinans TaxID=147558 RepID=A0A6A5T9M1_9PLEO|nr:hypothetical protein CC80DRAFT_581320 [Byssothecium circinans]